VQLQRPACCSIVSFRRFLYLAARAFKKGAGLMRWQVPQSVLTAACPDLNTQGRPSASISDPFRAILLRHPHNKPSNLQEDTAPRRLAGVRPFPSNELPVPPH
jgi:hypothetical protein